MEWIKSGKPGDCLNTKTVQYLSDREEEFVSLLVQIGTQKNVAMVLVFLAGAKKATSRMIERGVDLRQPEVSIALARLREKGWITLTETPAPSKGRPTMEVRLALPLRQILALLETSVRQETDRQLGLAHRLQTFV
jgi:predicted transcriptional regulator